MCFLHQLLESCTRTPLCSPRVNLPETRGTGDRSSSIRFTITDAAVCCKTTAYATEAAARGLLIATNVEGTEPAKNGDVSTCRIGFASINLNDF